MHNIKPIVGSGKGRRTDSVVGRFVCGTSPLSPIPQDPQSCGDQDQAGHPAHQVGDGDARVEGVAGEGNADGAHEGEESKFGGKDAAPDMTGDQLQ